MNRAKLKDAEARFLSYTREAFLIQECSKLQRNIK